jgi:hypothetical protein
MLVMLEKNQELTYYSLQHWLSGQTYLPLLFGPQDEFGEMIGLAFGLLEDDKLTEVAKVLIDDAVDPVFLADEEVAVTHDKS